LFRQLRHLANVLLDDMTLPNTGVIVCPRHSLFLSQTHFHVFGLFFPIDVPRISNAVSAVVDLYRSFNLTRKLVGPTPTGSDVIVTQLSRDQDGGDVAMSAQRRPEVFKQEAETLRRYERSRAHD